jgi:methyltransferase family protein
MFDFRSYFRRPISTLVAIVKDPIEAGIWFHEQYAAHREGHTPPDLYKPDADWEVRLHRLVKLASPDVITSEFWELWAAVMRELNSKGIQAGPESFKTWNDGDAGFVRAIWCLVRHLKPKHVLETGVAHGVSSRFILEALHRNGYGHLWSIDRQPMEREWKKQIGIAVAGRLKNRWSYINGSSRRRLPSLLSRLGSIDIFVHDSLHSERNVRFELDQAWAVLSSGGAIVVDDIDANRGFHGFSESVSDYHSLIGEAEPLRPDLRRFNQKGLFGIIVKRQIAPTNGA